MRLAMLGADKEKYLHQSYDLQSTALSSRFPPAPLRTQASVSWFTPCLPEKRSSP